MAIACLSVAVAAIPVAGAQQQSSQVYIDPLPFYNSVPHQMLLGHSYRLIVVVVDNGTSSQAGSVFVSFPQDYFFTDDPASSFQVLPGDTAVLNFTIVATGLNSSPMSVSAVLVQSQGLQNVAVQKVTATVDSIARDPVVYTALSLVGGVIAVAALLAARFYLRRKPTGVPK